MISRILDLFEFVIIVLGIIYTICLVFFRYKKLVISESEEKLITSPDQKNLKKINLGLSIL